MSPEKYLEISKIGNSRLIATELQKYSSEFREQYKLFGAKLRNKKYRDENSKKLNDARNKKRSDLKPIITKTYEVKDLDIEAVNLDVKRHYSNNLKIKDLKPNTVKTYKAVIKKLYKEYNTDELTDESDMIKYLNGYPKSKYSITELKKDFEFIIPNIKDIAKKHNKSINIIYAVFSGLGYGFKNIKDHLYPYVLDAQKKYDEGRERIIQDKEAVSKISFLDQDIINNLEKVEYPYDKVIYSLMFAMPTRRLHDYRFTKNASDIKDIEDVNFNWYYDNKIYINNTKNKKQIILILPKIIIDLINKLPVFGSYDYILGKAYDEAVLSSKFRSIMIKLYGSGFTASDIRALYISYNLTKGGNLSDLKENAVLQGHSLSENLKYAIKMN